jgi:hypothetical protein
MLLSELQYDSKRKAHWGLVDIVASAPNPHPRRVDPRMSTVDSNVARTNWPVKLYIATLLFAFVSLAIFTPTLSGRAINEARFTAQLAICAVLGLRLVWALHRREQSKAWIPYIVAMFLAVPIWLTIEPLVRSLWQG